MVMVQCTASGDGTASGEGTDSGDGTIGLGIVPKILRRRPIVFNFVP